MLTTWAPKLTLASQGELLVGQADRTSDAPIQYSNFLFTLTPDALDLAPLEAVSEQGFNINLASAELMSEDRFESTPNLFRLVRSDGSKVFIIARTQWDKDRWVTGVRFALLACGKTCWD